MKHNLFGAAAALCGALMLCADRAAAGPPKAVVDPQAIARIAAATNGITAMTSTTAPPPALWFPVGEETLYDVYWGIIHVGNARVTTEWVQREGKPLLRIRHVTRSNKVIATLYPVEDTMETVIDPVTFLPLYFRKKVSEGGYRADEMTAFHHAEGYAEWGSFRNGKAKRFPIEKETRDLVAFMYWMRRDRFVPGTTTKTQVMTDEKIYDLTLKSRAVETIKLDRYGKVLSVRLDPEAAFNGLFVRKGKMTVWVSDDPRRVCTRIDAEVPVASIHIYLDRVNGPGNDRWVQPKK